MKNAKINAVTLALLSALGISACGDSGSSQSSNTKTTSGVITGFGSVFVNGVEYETAGASVEVDGTAGSENDLEIGMVVTVEGSDNGDGTGTASAIRFADEVEGMVLANNITVDGTLDVMGQTVHVTTDTSFESYDAAHLAPADIPVNAKVEVSGYSDGSGVIYATRIEEKQHTAGDEIEVKGNITSLDTAASTFMIGSLTIDYSNATELPSPMANDLYVEVKSNSEPAGGVLAAAKVEIEDDGVKGEQGDEGEEIELEGVVTSVVSNTEITVNGQTVLLSTTTEFEDGATLAGLVAGAKIKVEGAFDANGVLVAEEIEMKQEGNIEMEGNLEAVDANAKTVTLFGATVQVTNTTMLYDDRDEGYTPVRYFSLTDLQAGDRIEVKAYRDDTGALVATKLKRDDSSLDPALLEGEVEALPASGLMTVAGFSVDVNGLSLPSLTVGAEVEIEGSFAGGVFTATLVTLDN